MATGECREAMDIIREKIREQVSRTPHAKASAISLAMGKELLMKGLVDEFGEGKKLSEEDFVHVIQKWSALSSPCVNNMIKHARVLCGWMTLRHLGFYFAVELQNCRQPKVVYPRRCFPTWPPIHYHELLTSKPSI